MKKSIILILALNNNQFDDVQVNSNRYEVGETIVVDSGLFNGLQCEILKTGNISRLLVRVASPNKNIIANIPLRDLTESFELTHFGSKYLISSIGPTNYDSPYLQSKLFVIKNRTC